jgi:plasmid stabilization system protein ParE
MTHRVVIQRMALEDLLQSHARVAKHAPETAARWLERFQSALRNLDQNPDRFPLAPENGRVAREIREFLFGKRPNVFRVVFTIEGDLVRVLRIRRAQRRFLNRSELDESIEGGP